MISRRFLVTASAASLAAMSLALGVSLASGSNNPPNTGPIHADRQITNQDVHTATAAVTAGLGAFARPTADHATSITEQTELRNQLGTNAGGAYGAIGDADFSMAKSAPIAGTTEKAYLVPSGDQVCIILPDPVDGYGATCQSLSDINAGKGVLTLTPQAGSGNTTSLVAVIVPDGGHAPELEGPKGTESLSVSGNIAASVASTKDSVVTEAGDLSLAAK